jgi:hypothetical protein
MSNIFNILDSCLECDDTYWPRYQGAYFFGDFSRKFIKFLSFDASYNLLNTWANAYSNVGAGVFTNSVGNQLIGLYEAPDGAMWYCTWNDIFRVTYGSAPSEFLYYNVMYALYCILYYSFLLHSILFYHAYCIYIILYTTVLYDCFGMQA